jgi:hypothetical protein
MDIYWFFIFGGVGLGALGGWMGYTRYVNYRRRSILAQSLVDIIVSSENVTSSVVLTKRRKTSQTASINSLLQKHASLQSSTLKG